ncbi:hypothetical protein M5K25_001963 [Dendrobium thyrsiflorum]|uniref:Uncharacterized protein n=1 Tax=Dendrobium thyrsiflorum TaxID=117978 RepID=A0ABD0W202_DENTH
MATSSLTYAEKKWRMSDLQIRQQRVLTKLGSGAKSGLPNIFQLNFKKFQYLYENTFFMANRRSKNVNKKPSSKMFSF